MIKTFDTVIYHLYFLSILKFDLTQFMYILFGGGRVRSGGGVGQQMEDRKVN